MWRASCLKNAEIKGIGTRKIAIENFRTPLQNATRKMASEDVRRKPSPKTLRAWFYECISGGQAFRCTEKHTARSFSAIFKWRTLRQFKSHYCQFCMCLVCQTIQTDCSDAWVSSASVFPQGWLPKSKIHRGQINSSANLSFILHEGNKPAAKQCCEVCPDVLSEKMSSLQLKECYTVR